MVATMEVCGTGSECVPECEHNWQQCCESMWCCKMGSKLKYLIDGNPIIKSDVTSLDTILSTKIWRNFINLSGTGTATVIEMKP